MKVTRIDCYCCKTSGAGEDSCSYLAINPDRSPGGLVFVGSSAAHESLGSQVACKLALEHFVEGVLSYFNQKTLGHKAEAAHNETSLQVLEAAFRSANSSVYDFGHKLAAGGRLAASLIGLVLEDNIIAAGRVGPGSAYLWRKGELFPFFEGRTQQYRSNLPATQPEAFVGSQSVVSVELASVPLQSQDVVVVFSDWIDAAQERELEFALNDIIPAYQDKIMHKGEAGSQRPQLAEEIVHCIFPPAGPSLFVLMAVVGPETIYLRETVASNVQEGL